MPQDRPVPQDRPAAQERPAPRDRPTRADRAVPPPERAERPRRHRVAEPPPEAVAPPAPPRRRRPAGPPPDERPTEVIELDDSFYDEEEDSFLDEYGNEYDESEEDYYDEDDESEEDRRAEPEYIDDDRPPRRGRREKKRRAFGWVAAIAVIALLAGGAWFGIDKIFGYEDFEGDGTSDVLVQVMGGDSTNAIGTRLAESGVVASPKAFVKAAEDDSRVRSVQPGYYQLKKQMSGTSAVSRLIQPTARVGVLQLRAGTQLDDIKQPDQSTTDGVYAQLAKASCANLDGASTCVPVEELRKVAEDGDLVALGVPKWAADAVAKTDKKRRIEGLIAPGVYDVKPGWNATELLSAVFKESADRMQEAGLPDGPKQATMTPYQTLVIASLIEREGIKKDFEKVSRVIYNRLAKNMKLELDSTVNYVLDRPMVRTNRDDRSRPGPYNTYLNTGLPPTPISAPSKEAIAAAQKPADGEWLFFVKCDKNGMSCFAVTNAEHDKNVAEALARGAY
ncbi:hypothetical protein HUW46_07749 [Amycolatopsis sp. CA-230715]|nr:hypothetical protein HUW46_07749 [Amycolatopsis sp. CA-230715]